MTDLWVINKKVYNLTSFLDHHPGGNYILKLAKSRDCTELFYSYHISSKLPTSYFENKLNNYYIRNALPHEITSKFNWDSKPNYELFKHKLITIPNIKASYLTRFNYALLSILGIFTWILWLKANFLSLILVPLWGLYFAGEILHSSTHYAIFKSPKLNNLISYLGMYHCLPLTWYHQHVISHHTHPNIPNRDADINTRCIDFLGLGWRTNTHQPYKNYFKYYKYTKYLGIPSTSFDQTFIKPVFSLFTNTFGGVIKFTYAGFLDKTNFIIQFLGLVLLFGIMIYLHNLPIALIFCFVPRALHGTLTYMAFKVAHITEHAFLNLHNPQEYTQQNPNQEWIIHQILSTVDHSTQSRLISYLVIGLNNHVVHHICPAVHPDKYRKINLLLQEFCQEQNIKYTNYTSYWNAWEAHNNYLNKLN